jgi:hypothetical protein
MPTVVPVSGIGGHGAERNRGAQGSEKNFPHREFLLPMK